VSVLDEQIAQTEAILERERERHKLTFSRTPGGLIRFRGMPWTGPAKARRATTCAWSGKPIAKGDLTFHPISNGLLRSLRVLASEWPS